MNFKSFKAILPLLTNAATKWPVMLRAKHGVGKSQLVYQLAEHLNLPVIERRASQMTEGDLLGLPKLEDNVTKFLAPEWLNTACTKPVLLFIDEIDRATQEVRQGFFELCDSRKIAGYHLHKDTLVFSAVNSGTHGNNYQIGELDPAERDRWTIFDLEPDLEDWIEWAKEDENIHPTIVGFIRNQPKFLEHNDDYDPTDIYPSRRSWHRLSDVVKQHDLITPAESNPLLVHLASGFVGNAAAIGLDDYVQTLQKQVKPKDLLDDGKFNLLKEFKINDHLKVIEMAKDQNLWQNKLTKKQVGNYVKWFCLLPSELAMKLWEDITENVTDREPTALHNAIEINKHETFKKALKGIIYETYEKEPDEKVSEKDEKPEKVSKKKSSNKKSKK